MLLLEAEYVGKSVKFAIDTRNLTIYIYVAKHWCHVV